MGDYNFKVGDEVLDKLTRRKMVIHDIKQGPNGRMLATCEHRGDDGKSRVIEDFYFYAVTPMTDVSPSERFPQLARLLLHEEVEFQFSSKSVLSWFYANMGAFASGITNRPGMTPIEQFLYIRVGGVLAIHGLVQDEPIPGGGIATASYYAQGQ